MTEDEKEQVWNALFRGKVAAVALYARMCPIDNLRTVLESVEAEFDAAMDIIMMDDPQPLRQRARRGSE